MPKLKATIPIMLLMRDISLLEHDAQAQYKFNRFWAIFWALMMIVVLFFPSLYNHDFAALIIIEVTIWSSFATHFGSMSAALATKRLIDEEVKPAAKDILPPTV